MSLSHKGKRLSWGPRRETFSRGCLEGGLGGGSGARDFSRDPRGMTQRGTSWTTLGSQQRLREHHTDYLVWPPRGVSSAGVWGRQLPVGPTAGGTDSRRDRQPDPISFQSVYLLTRA